MFTSPKTVVFGLPFGETAALWICFCWNYITTWRTGGDM